MTRGRPPLAPAERLERIGGIWLLPDVARRVEGAHAQRLATTGARLPISDTLRWLIALGLEACK